VDLNMYWQTKGGKPWHELQKFPRFYVSTRIQQIGDKDIVGGAFVLSGGMEVAIFRKSNSALHFGLSTGYAYLTKPYDRITNPINNAIGSHGNSAVTVKFDYEMRAGKNWMLHAGTQLMHYSNGASKLPNLGLNIPGLYLGISPYSGTYDQDFYHLQGSSKEADQKFAFGLYTMYAQVEMRVPGGPRYPVHVVGADLLYHLNINHRLSLGYQYDYNGSIAAFGLHTGDFVDEEEAFRGASRHSINFGHEFLIGPYALHLKTGIYLNREVAFLVPRPFYFQLSPRYYFNAQSKFLAKFYTSLNLKTHLFVAEHISIGIGIVIR